MARTLLEYRQEALDLFLEKFSGMELPKPEYFRDLLRPETEQVSAPEEPEALRLLVLRLYEAGFRDPASMASLCGVPQATVENILNNEGCPSFESDTVTREEVAGDA